MSMFDNLVSRAGMIKTAASAMLIGFAGTTRFAG